MSPAGRCRALRTAAGGRYDGHMQLHPHARRSRLDQPWSLRGLHGERVELDPGPYTVIESPSTVEVRSVESDERVTIDYAQFEFMLRSRALVFLSW